LFLDLALVLAPLVDERHEEVPLAALQGACGLEAAAEDVPGD
jgi:hypothetical protein